MSAQMTQADFEMFQKFLAFQQMTAAPDAVTAVADAVKAPVNAPQETNTAVATAETVKTVTIKTAGGYGVQGTDDVTYSVGPKNRDARGKIFAGFTVGETVAIAFDAKGKALSVARVSDADPVVIPAPITSAPKLEQAIETAERIAAGTRKNGTTRPDCVLCNGSAHPNEGLACIVCLARQYTNETGLLARVSEGFGAEFVAFAMWVAAEPRRAYAKNTDGFKIYGGSAVKAAPAAPVTAPAAPVTAPAAPVTAPAAPVTAPAVKAERAHCLTCRRFVKAGETYHEKCKPAVDPAVLAAMASETVHIDAFEDDDEPVVQEEPAVKAPSARSQTDINAMSGVFDVTLDGLPKIVETAIKSGDSAQIDAAVAAAKLLARFKSDEFVTGDGRGRWFQVTREMLATLTARRVKGRTNDVRISLTTGSVITKIGNRPAAAIETNLRPDVGPAKGAKAAERAAARAAQQARATTTITNMPTDLCPKCDRRFSVAGMGQNGLCKTCAPLPVKGTGRKAS